VPKPGAIVAGSIRWRGRELVGAGERRLRRVRGGEIGMIFQEPMTSLNPLMTIGRQISEAIVLHQGVGRREAMDRAVDALLAELDGKR